MAVDWGSAVLRTHCLFSLFLGTVFLGVTSRILKCMPVITITEVKLTVVKKKKKKALKGKLAFRAKEEGTKGYMS